MFKVYAWLEKAATLCGEDSKAIEENDIWL